MTGMGGGLMTPMLILLFGFDPKTAVGTDILHGAVFVPSFGRHRQLGNVHVWLALWMLLGSAPLVCADRKLVFRTRPNRPWAASSAAP